MIGAVPGLAGPVCDFSAKRGQVSLACLLRFVVMVSRIRQVFQRELTSGLNAQGGALALATAFTIGVFPIIGFSTPLNTLAAVCLRLNQPIIQVINWVMGPLKLLLIIPFLRLGEALFSAEPFTLSLTQFSQIFFADWWGTTQEFAWTFVHVICGWLVVAPLLFGLLFGLGKLLFRRHLAAVGSAVSDCALRG